MPAVNPAGNFRKIAITKQLLQRFSETLPKNYFCDFAKRSNAFPVGIYFDEKAKNCLKILISRYHHRIKEPIFVRRTIKLFLLVTQQL